MVPHLLPEDSCEQAPAAIVLHGFAHDQAAAITDGLDSPLPVVAARDARTVAGRLADGSCAVLCLGPELPGEIALRLLEEHAAGARLEGVPCVVLAGGEDLGRFQDLVDGDYLYYLTRRSPCARDVRRILDGAAAVSRQARVGGVPENEQVVQLAAPLADARSLEQAAPMLARAVATTLRTERTTCLLYDVLDQTLWAPGNDHGRQREESAAAGLVGYALRAAVPARVATLHEDPRFDADADTDGLGGDDDRLLAVPVVAPGTHDARGQAVLVLAVLVAWRGAAEKVFSQRDERRLVFLAAQVAHPLQRLSLVAVAQRRRALEMPYRREALAHQDRVHQDEGRPLQLSPAWTRGADRVVVPLVAMFFAFLLLATDRQYAQGGAVVRIGDRTRATSAETGTVRAVHVRSGVAVRAGDPLVALDDQVARAELAQLAREHELRLIERLRAPTDPATGRALTGLVQQLDRARARLRARTVRASVAGVVGDVRVRAGQLVTPGQVVATLRRGAATAAGDGEIWALVPGYVRPHLRPGMPLRLTLEGHPHARLRLAVDTVAEDVVGPSEALRLLGPGSADVVPLTGSAVLIRSRLPGPTFESDGEAVAYHDGMVGTVELAVREERLLFALLPGLREVVRR